MSALNLRLAVVLTILSQICAQQFNPGCSFFNGKCVYNVQLGSDCSTGADQTPISPDVRDISGSCTCNDVTKVSNELDSLQNLVDRLQKSMMDFKNQLNNGSSKNSSQLIKPSGESQKYIQLLKTIKSKDELLNRTKEEVSMILKTASTEINILQEKLKTTTGELASCKIQQGTTHNTQTEPAKDYTTFYCNFQNSDMCRFTQDHDDDATWRRTQSAISSTSGPKTDHTYGNSHGYYMALKTTDTSKNRASLTTGRITSPTFSPAPNYCIRFWYTMYGKDIDKLNVYAKVHGGRGYPIYTVTGNQGPYWHLAQIDLGTEYTKSSFQITFEGLHHAYKESHYNSGKGYYYTYFKKDGNIAIDDFYVYNTTCNSIPTYPKHSIVRVDGNTTSHYTFHTTPANWYDAQDVCRKDNVHSYLATIKSSGEQQFLENYINSQVDLVVAGKNGFFLNGNDVDSENQFKWTETGYPQSIIYSNFHPGQPNNVGDNQDCLLMEYPDSNYQWGDVPCTEKHPFICETKI